MTARTLIFAAVLLLAAGAVTKGAATASEAAGWIVGGVLLAGWAWLVLGENTERDE